MPVARARVMLALAAAAAVVLAGCGGSTSTTATDSASTSTGSSSPAAAGDLPTVTGDFGQKPDISIPSTAAPTGLQVKVLHKGDGATVKAKDTVVADYSGVTWSGVAFDSSFDRGAPASFQVGAGQLIKGWDEALVGQRVGSRVLVVIPPDLGYGDNPPQGSGIEAGATLVFVVDVIDLFAPDASAKGKATPVQDDGVPGVTVAPGEPTITIPAGGPPPNLIAAPVVTGPGPKVASGDLIVVQYKGETWRTGKVFDSSWQRGAPVGFTIGQGQVISGWDEGLVGQPVGSRVLLVIPADKAYGSSPPAGSGIKPGDTLVFAVDILGAY